MSRLTQRYHSWRSVKECLGPCTSSDGCNQRVKAVPAALHRSCHSTAVAIVPNNCAPAKLRRPACCADSTGRIVPRLVQFCYLIAQARHPLLCVGDLQPRLNERALEIGLGPSNLNLGLGCPCLLPSMPSLSAFPCA